METAMTNTRSKIIAAALAAVTLAGTFAATSGQAQAGSYHKFGVGLGIGFATGALVGAAASGAFAGPVYRECHYVRRYNHWGEWRLVKVCNYY
jgi:hypothetical protein